jgi:hypothetical protein
MTTKNDSMSFPETPEQQHDQPQVQLPEFEFPPTLTLADTVQTDPWSGFRKFLACNPLYLLSAALLLYSFYLVSADVAFFKTDFDRLFFNLGSLQIYEALLVVTAVWLARRAAWYDSTLLTGLENLLLLAPFILLSEAALIDSKAVWLLGIGAAGVAAARMGLLKKFIRELNFPRGAVASGLLVLAVNTAMLIVYRVLQESKFGKQPDFGAAFQTHQYTWWILLPLVVALGKIVPFCSNMSGAEWPKRPWLPLAFYSLWLAGTCVHFYSLGYVYDFELRPDLVAPALWVLAWLVWLKLSRIASDLTPEQIAMLWTLPALATLFALGQPSKTVYLILTVVNIGAYVMLYAGGKDRAALHLALISCVALLAGFPEEWGERLFEGFSRRTFVMASCAAYLLIRATMSHDAKAGLLGSIVSVFIALALLRGHPDVEHWTLQIALVYLLLHSIRWNDASQDGAGVVRWLAASGWVLHSFVWVGGEGGGWELVFMAGLALSVAFVARWFARLPLRAALICSASIVLLSHPLCWSLAQLKETPAGVLAVIASFLLFGCGTLAALSRNRCS